MTSQNAALAKYALLTFQLLGIAASAFLVAVTFLSPDEVEQRLQAFAVTKVEHAANAAWAEASNNPQIGTRAERLGQLATNFGLDAQAIDEKRETIVPALMAYALSDRCSDNCGLAVITGFVANSIMLEQAAKLRVGQTTIGDFIVERYETTVRGLLNDLRLFGMVNVVALTLMAALLLLRNMLNWRFAALSVGVTAYAAWAAYGYIYTQNWALTILLQDWAADGYKVGMIFICCMLSDWLFLRGFVTRLVANAISIIVPG